MTPSSWPSDLLGVTIVGLHLGFYVGVLVVAFAETFVKRKVKS